MPEIRLNSKIFRYPIEITDLQDIEMPAGAEILCVKSKRGVPCIWAKVLDGSPYKTRHIRIIGTGKPMVFTEGRQLHYLGTVFTHNESLVWHIYEEIETR